MITLANIALINYYASLVKRGTYKLESIEDESVRTQVEKRINGESISENTEVTNNTTVSEETTSSLYGPLTIGNLTKEINTESLSKSGHSEISFDLSELFSNVPEGNEYPKDVQLEVIRVEDTYGKFKEVPDIQITITDTTVKTKISAIPIVDFTAGYEVFRLDLKVISSNYEEMKFTIYVNAK